MTVKSFLMIPNRKIPAVGNASYGRDFLFEQKSSETLVVSKLNRKFAAKTIIMRSYGRKIIDYIFKRWAERPAICYEPERKVQADSDRSDIRVFETGLSTQQYGDNRQSTRTAEEEECLRLIKIAKEQGLYIDKSDWGKFGDRRMIPTGERTYRRRINDTLFVSVDPSHPYR